MGKTAWLLLMALAVACSNAAGSAEWRSRSVYQIMTDRFAKTDGTGGECDKKNYCGGTWKGIQNKLDYIQGMGFDAIWISPIQQNQDKGYHGYWVTDFFNVNKNFGTEQDLRDLISEAHNRSMLVMVDMVCNHVGSGPISPFNHSEHYHDCNGCPSNCGIKNWDNTYEKEHCRLYGMMDLNQDGNTWVRDQLVESAKWITSFGADGIRLDAVPHVNIGFWNYFKSKVGTFTIGEVSTGDMQITGKYQGAAMDSVLSYPFYYTLQSVFGKTDGQCLWLGNAYKGLKQWHKDTGVLGTFTDCHDQKRFLNTMTDRWRYRNALAYAIMADGIPMIYYGSEQMYAGGEDPENREPLWWSKYNTQSELYLFIQKANSVRKDLAVYNTPQEERWSDGTCYAFVRGKALVVLTNVGHDGPTISHQLSFLPYKNGEKVCNVFWPNDDCLIVKDGKATVSLTHGEAKIYRPY